MLPFDAPRVGKLCGVVMAASHFLLANVTIHNLFLLGQVLISWIFLYYALVVLYNLFLHPLRHFPGPVLAGATPLYWIFYNLVGKRHVAAAQLHSKYGEVVRVAPNQLSFIGEDAWKDIYMHKQGRSQLQKLRRGRPADGVYNIITAPDDIHARQRKMLSHAFSEKALREQEDVLILYIDLLMANLREDAMSDRPVDIVSTFNFATFDIIGELSFAESFRNLELRRPHPWLTTIFNNVRNIAMFETLSLIPGLLRLVIMLSRFLMPQSFKLDQHAHDQITKRIENGSERPDFMSKILPHKREDGTGISRAEIDATTVILIIGGSETTATLLSGAVYFLLRNPSALEKLQQEIRSSFQNTAEISSIKVGQLPYISAVLEESLRLYPPVPVALSRLTPPEGTTICGRWIPGNALVGVPQRAAYRSPINFVEPSSFIPERWLPSKDPKFERDRKAVFQPFSTGPRNCLGRNLAYAEMRLILARLVYEFDFELMDKDQQWDNQKVFILYDKPPLMLRMQCREQSV